MKVSGHISDTLAKVVKELMSGWKVLHAIANIDWKYGGSPEGTWVLGPGIEIASICSSYPAKVHKNSVREKIKQCETDLMF